jgi:hypothetical protein
VRFEGGFRETPCEHLAACSGANWQSGSGERLPSPVVWIDSQEQVSSVAIAFAVAPQLAQDWGEGSDARWKTASWRHGRVSSGQCEAGHVNAAWSEAEVSWIVSRGVPIECRWQQHARR